VLSVGLHHARVHRGKSAVRAIEDVRSINSYYIQSRPPLELIGRFEGSRRSYS